MPVVQGGNRVPCPFLMIPNGSRSKLFDGDKNTNAVTNLLDAHFLQNDLITFNEITSVDIVD